MKCGDVPMTDGSTQFLHAFEKDGKRCCCGKLYINSGQKKPRIRRGR